MQNYLEVFTWQDMSRTRYEAEYDSHDEAVHHLAVSFFVNTPTAIKAELYDGPELICVLWK